MTERLLTRAEVAKWLGIPSATLARWACEGKGPAYYAGLGKHVRYSRRDVERWLDGQRRDPEKTEAPLPRDPNDYPTRQSLMGIIRDVSV